MKIKELLNLSFTLDLEVKAKEEQILVLREQSVRIGNTLTLDKVQSTKQSDPIGDIVSRIVDMENEYLSDVKRLLKLKAKIKEIIERLESPEQRLILTQRYINLKTWEEIAAENGYNLRSVYKIHTKAILGIERHYVRMI